MNGRPAELGTAGLGAIGIALSAALGLTQPWTSVVMAVIAVTPGVISYCVDHGGLVGAIKSFFVGHPKK